MSHTIKLTAKRQATFPVELCEGLGLQPGDEIDLLARKEKGEVCWLLKKHEPSVRLWAGTLRQYASNAEDHSMEAIQDSIVEGRRRNKS